MNIYNITMISIGNYLGNSYYKIFRPFRLENFVLSKLKMPSSSFPTFPCPEKRGFPENTFADNFLLKICKATHYNTKT
ncbi:MAG TPA: hypothetical protein DHV48_10365 [Prolixibacteraceae bacterium]|nr:hypothetical protein [Prolixibacteraceae bacterium]